MQQPYPPLATLYAAALMRKEGYSVSLFDVQLAAGPHELEPYLNPSAPDKAPKYLVVYDDGFNYLTKMCLTNMRDAAFSMMARAGEQGCTVIVSSSDATDRYAKYLDAGAHYVIAGEAEYTLLELIKTLERKGDPKSVNGLIFREPEGADEDADHKPAKTIRTPARLVSTALDELPHPAWDLVDMQAYRKVWLRKNGYFSLNLVTTRGCPYKCNWCAKPIYGNRYNCHSPRYIAEQLKHLLPAYGPEHIWFADDIFGLNPAWTAEFAEIVAQEGLKFRFKIQSRADLLLKEGAITHLAKAGAETVWIGAESGSQKILDAMDKGTRVEQIYEATRAMKAAGIKPAFFLQFGYPGEGPNEIAATLKMLLDLMPHEIGISVSYPLPGTKFYESVKAELSSKTNWTDSDELAMLFAGKYSGAYYKRLHRYVHKVFRRRQSLLAWKRFFRNPAELSGLNIYRLGSLAYYLPGAYMDRIRLKRLEKTELQQPD